jgi:hypothetical protein
MHVEVMNTSISLHNDRFEKLLRNIALIKSRGGMDVAEFQKMIADKVEAREMDIEDIMILLAWIDFEGEKVIISKEAQRKLEELVKLARKAT